MKLCAGNFFGKSMKWNEIIVIFYYFWVDFRLNSRNSIKTHFCEYKAIFETKWDHRFVEPNNWFLIALNQFIRQLNKTSKTEDNERQQMLRNVWIIFRHKFEVKKRFNQRILSLVFQSIRAFVHFVRITHSNGTPFVVSLISWSLVSFWSVSVNHFNDS